MFQDRYYMQKLKFILISALSIFFIFSATKCTSLRGSKYNRYVAAITAYQHTIEELREQVENLQSQVVRYQELSAIDNFLNITNASIFNRDFQSFNLDDIHLRSRDYYLLIQSIHSLSVLIRSAESRTLAQVSETVRELEEALQLINTINQFTTDEKRRVTDFLSPEQRQYLHSLADRYNEMNSRINR